MASNDLINTIIAEAGGEGEAGLTAAIWAIAQRAAARGQTMDQVIRQGFDGYTNPGEGAKRDQRNPEMRARVENLISGVQNGTIPNPVPGADHFLSGDVMPSWAKSMTPVATIGGHRFYASGQVPKSAQGTPLPPGELPSVATAMDVRRPVAPSNPTAMSPQLAAQRQLTAQLNSGQMTAPGSEYANAYMATPRSSAQTAIAQALSQGQNSQPDASFYNGIYSQPRATAPPTVQTIGTVSTKPQVSGSISYAGQDRGPARPAEPSVQTIGYVPTKPQVSGAMSYAGQERAPPLMRAASQSTTLPPIAPSVSVPDNYFDATLSRAAAANRPALATALTHQQQQTDNGQSPRIGQPPVTRSVASMAVPAAAVQGPNAIQQQRSEQLATRQTTPVRTPAKPVGAPNATQVQAGTGFRVPNLATQPPSVIQNQARLTPGVYPAAPAPVASAVPLAAPQMQVTPRRVVSGYPTGANLRPGASAPLSAANVGFPTSSALRPLMGSIAQPRMVSSRPPLNVIVQGANTQQPSPLMAQAAATPAYNPANHSQAQLQALAAGRSGYSDSDGALQPVYAMNGKLRNTY